MTELAVKKLDKQCGELGKCDRRIEVMKQAVHDALVEFCRQDGEFAQAVVQGGTFADCMAAVAKNVGSAISDIEAYRRAAQFYFPGADIRVKMTVNLCASVEQEEPEQAGRALVEINILFGQIQTAAARIHDQLGALDEVTRARVTAALASALARVSAS